MYTFYCLDPRASIISMNRTIRSSISSNTITALIINKAVKNVSITEKFNLSQSLFRYLYRASNKCSFICCEKSVAPRLTVCPFGCDIAV